MGEGGGGEETSPLFLFRFHFSPFPQKRLILRLPRTLIFSLRTADAFPVVASLPPKKSFSEEEKRRPEMRLRFAGYLILALT